MPSPSPSSPERIESSPGHVGGPVVNIATLRRRARPAERSVVFKTTDQLRPCEREQMCELFLRVFGKTMTSEAFERKYFCTPKGYSYHGLLCCRDSIVGALTAVPVRYMFFDIERIFCLSVDTMIAPEHRGGGHFVTMARHLHEGLVRDGIGFIFGFPNESFYPLQKRFLKYTDIGELDYYILPVNLGTVLGRHRLLNGFSRALCHCLRRWPRIAKNGPGRPMITKVADAQFEQHRYDSSYARIALGDRASCIYKIYTENGGIRTLYLIDVLPSTPSVVARAIKHVLRAETHAVDVILYVGTLPAPPAGLFKVPDSKKPRRMRMTGKILVPNWIDARVLQFENWQVNISDCDVR